VFLQLRLTTLPGLVKWDLWWTKWRWGGFSPSISVSLANLHSTKFSIIIVTRSRYNRPISGRRAEWTQLDSKPHYANLKNLKRQDIVGKLSPNVAASRTGAHTTTRLSYVRLVLRTYDKNSSQHYDTTVILFSYGSDQLLLSQTLDLRGRKQRQT
jgi:hypothetical protein